MTQIIKGDCNTRLETPLILALSNRHVTMSIILLSSPNAELDFATISNVTARKIIQEEISPIYELLFDANGKLHESDLLGKYSEIKYHFGKNNRATKFEIRIEDKLNVHYFRIKRKVPEPLSQR